MGKISIVIPACNESENITPLIGEILAAGLSHPYEIIIVDDASKDGTYDAVLEMKREVHHVRVLQHECTYGQSAAIATGIAHADGELIVTMDGDGQNNPADIPAMISAMLTSSDPHLRMIVGHRKKRNDSSWRIISSKVANSVKTFFLRDQTPDTGCGLKVFYRSAFMNLPFFDHMHLFLPALIQMQGGTVISMEVTHRARTHGASKYGTLNRLRVGIVDIMGVYWLRLRAKKIKIRRCD